MVILNTINPHSMSEGTLVLVNPPKKSKKVKRNMPARKTTKKNTRKAVRRGSTKASRSAAAKKAARTRKANAAKRSRAAKKAAATRKRNAAKRSAAGKKAAASRKRKTSRKSTAKRGPSKAKRSAAAKKGWRTRRAKSAKRSNAAKRAARSRKAKTTRRKTVKRKSTAKKSGRMTKAKRSAAAKKGWRTRRAGGSKRRVSKRRVKRKASRRSAKMGGLVNKFAPVKGAMAGANSVVDSVSMKTVDSLMDVTKGAAAGMGMLGLLAVAKGGIWNKIGVTDMVASVASGLPADEDLVSAFDAMLDLATIGAIGVALDKGLGTNKKLIAAGTAGASLLVAIDFLSSIKTFGIGDTAVGISQGDIPGVGLLSSLNPFAGAHNLGSLGMATSEKMFGMHNQAAMGMAHGNMGMMHGAHGSNNLALAMSPNNTAATGNAKFFGTKSLGSTRVNLF